MEPKTFFVFDVESVGLHGEGFAVAGGVLHYPLGVYDETFCFACPPADALGSAADREWVDKNVPALDCQFATTEEVRAAFWVQWTAAKVLFPGILMVAECLWPVEAGFVEACICDDIETRNWEGPYPFHEIASIMFAAGMDPMATYDRLPSELPKHDPLADARQSARLLTEALSRLQS